MSKPKNTIPHLGWLKSSNVSNLESSDFGFGFVLFCGLEDMTFIILASFELSYKAWILNVFFSGVTI